ncbi:MAG: geranylgeranylglycerol-phosphate geranylgeranyltransferase [Cyclobacteriaceae bacterium]|nr:geranylgeranylglycerol-phosphate geranylgeranyltransferase [Cyclobacteriaceae bacterium]
MRFISIADLFRLTRFWNLVIIAVAQYLAATFLLHRYTAVFTDLSLFVLSLSTVLIAAAGYIINDYYDIKIDLINKPDRVVIGKSITRRYAIFFHTFISIIGILLGLWLSWKIAAINFVCVFLLWLYSNQLKRKPFVGNLLVAILTGLSIWLINWLYQEPNTFVIIYSLFAFFMTLIREIVKDMEDMKGDTTFGCRTLPIVWGIRKTKMLLYSILFVFSIAVTFFNFCYALVPLIYFIVFLLVPMALLTLRLIRADTVKEYHHLSQLCKVIMLLGVISMVFV